MSFFGNKSGIHKTGKFAQPVLEPVKEKSSAEQRSVIDQEAMMLKRKNVSIKCSYCFVYTFTHTHTHTHTTHKPHTQTHTQASKQLMAKISKRGASTTTSSPTVSVSMSKRMCRNRKNKVIEFMSELTGDDELAYKTLVEDVVLDKRVEPFSGPIVDKTPAAKVGRNIIAHVQQAKCTPCKTGAPLDRLKRTLIACGSCKPPGIDELENPPVCEDLSQRGAARVFKYGEQKGQRLKGVLNAVKSCR